MPHRPTPPDEPRRRSRRRDEAKRPAAEPHSFGEEGRYSSDQARYYGADPRSFDAFGAHRPSETRPDWRRGRYESRPCKNVLSDGGAEVETKRRTPRAQARIASINGLVPITAITRFIL